eukprot:TRINITY_DN5633_c0_g1_i1.p1 TRINITY_DN5633_c0_g1~~TRINITY_DN5633_c0_g1_i1.p1  ORF type:complete len:264 (-),score=18.12 TRINITY_DN5633_c0_g1_i1:648-1439(-)
MAGSLLEAGLSFAAGYACRSQCGPLPCSARFTSASRPFKLSVVVHSASLKDLETGPGVVQNQRPYVSVSVQDRVKETEPGDWEKNRGQWLLRETLTVIAEADDEIRMAVHCATRYDLYVAALSVNSQRLGEICFPVADVVSKLKADDRDEDGVVWASPITAFDVVQDGRVSGRLHVSFETQTPPPSLKAGDLDQCCGWDHSADFARYRSEDYEASTMASSRSSRGTSASGTVWSRPVLPVISISSDEPEPSLFSARTAQFSFR